MKTFLQLKQPAVRQMTAIGRIPYYLSEMLAALFKFRFARFAACVVAVFQLLGTFVLDSPMPLTDNKLDLTGYECIFSDEFNGTQLDRQVWEESFPLGTGEKYDESMMSFDGECMRLSTEYRDGPKGEGWYSYGIQNTDEYMKFSTGYFEARCKCPSAKGMWSAFWLLTNGSDGVNTVPQESLGEYTEIDVMESFYFGQKYPDTAIHTVHHWIPEKFRYDSEQVGKYHIGADPYETFNTYGVMWTPDEFIFYINGVESGRTSHGASVDPARMLLTVQVDLREGNVEINDNDASAFPTDFAVDYVRVYQK